MARMAANEPSAETTLAIFAKIRGIRGQNKSSRPATN